MALLVRERFAEPGDEIGIGRRRQRFALDRGELCVGERRDAGFSQMHGAALHPLPREGERQAEGQRR